ncbi:putative transferase CAF17 homolog, mitochondrial [Watersipora subatra]|uniref:putative transferase CAF17 homolog, mitochondrial n=1 Tax=Watersipora subatra TaxID=2589382 RepID=UPI00355B36DA
MRRASTTVKFITTGCEFRPIRARNISTESQLSKRPFTDFSLARLHSKSLLRLSGSDVYPFLQGILTNDVQILEHGASSLYTQLLNIKGRVLCDLILYNDTKEAGNVLVEVDSSQTDLLIKTFKKYKIRKKVKIENETNNLASYAAFGCFNEQPETDVSSIAMYRDPRIPQLGWRILSSQPVSHELDSHAQEEDAYRQHRYKLGVGEGPEEHIPEKSLPLECNSFLLHGVSFSKGCFIGQELTSRSHHTGVIRKRIMPVTYSSAKSLKAQSEVKLCATDKSAGTVRCGVNGYGLALLRVNDVLKNGAAIYTTDSNGDTLELSTNRPNWWPEGVGVL